MLAKPVPPSGTSHPSAQTPRYLVVKVVPLRRDYRPFDFKDDRKESRPGGTNSNCPDSHRGSSLFIQKIIKFGRIIYGRRLKTPSYRGQL